MEGQPMFRLGAILITPGAESLLTPQELLTALHRHQHGDFGDLTPEDFRMNHRGLSTCGMIMSVYHSASGPVFWIQTHGTRSHTTILLPGE